MGDRTYTYLPHHAWPAADQSAWRELFREGDVLDGRGPAAHWAPATRRSNHQHYARWLGWLAWARPQELALHAVERITPDPVRVYSADLVARVAPRTVTSSLIGLKVVARALAPEAEWRWLYDLTNRLNTWAKPSRDPQDRIVPIEQAYRACLRELTRLSSTPLKRRLNRVSYRDTLITALLCAAPVRLRNLAMIAIDWHLVRSGDQYGLRFGAGETKNGQPLALDLAASLTPFIDIYLERVRSTFLKDACSANLWLGFEGGPLTAHSIYGRVLLVTERLLGCPINPHAFRACAATSLSLRSPAETRLAAPLLGHRYFATTERHYLRAQQLDASRAVSQALARITSRFEEEGSDTKSR
jgi:integrase